MNKTLNHKPELKPDRGYLKRVEHLYEGGSWTIIDSEDSLGVNLNIKPEL